MIIALVKKKIINSKEKQLVRNEKGRKKQFASEKLNKKIVKNSNNTKRKTKNSYF